MLIAKSITLIGTMFVSLAVLLSELITDAKFVMLFNFPTSTYALTGTVITTLTVVPEERVPKFTLPIQTPLSIPFIE